MKRIKMIIISRCDVGEWGENNLQVSSETGREISQTLEAIRRDEVRDW